MADQKQRELGDFLRARRGRLTPESVGLPHRRQRRTPGLRREEVAELAGIGVDWYIRLEQGRPVTPSIGTVDALARALRLTELEHQHLRALAGGGGHRPFQPETAPPALLRLLESLTQPAYVTGRRRDLVAWNAAADEVFDFSSLAEDQRNILVSMLTHPRSRDLFGRDWADEAQADGRPVPRHPRPLGRRPGIRGAAAAPAPTAARNSTPGGSATTSAVPPQASRRCTTRRRA